MIKFYISRNVKSPERRDGSDAGFDFFVPIFDEKFIADFKAANEANPDYIAGNVKIEANKVVIGSLCSVKIPSGIHMLIPSNECVKFGNKSGVAWKKRLIVTSDTIDSSYEGETNIVVCNVSNYNYEIEESEKIVQAIPYMIDNEAHKVVDAPEMTLETFYAFHDKTRGSQGFCSTSSWANDDTRKAEELKNS